jgi:hypothetical protein
LASITPKMMSNARMMNIRNGGLLINSTIKEFLFTRTCCVKLSYLAIKILKNNKQNKFL